jgi:hypothetical protein
MADGLGLTVQTVVSLSEGPLLPRLAIACLALALPAGLWLLVRTAAASLLPGRGRPWLLLYALLPLLLSVMLAHHLALGMAEAGMVLPVSVGPWLGGSALQLPSWSADPHVIGFCQTLAVGVGLAGSVVLLRRLLLPDRLGWLLQAALTLLIAGAGRWLVAVG